jgi:ABC-type transport system involved in multi-copper enzyme maturation permease subunit
MDLALSNLPLFAIASWARPLWIVALGVLVAAALLAGVIGLLRVAVPKIAAIAWTTGKEAVSQPLFYVLLAIGIFLLFLFPFLPYNTFGEDVKILKDTGLTLIMVLSVLLALWTASVSIADEIEGRTALTVLCKPIGRRDFILGKYLGILGPVAILFIVLGGIFLCSVSYKVAYDARETSMPDPTWLQCYHDMAQVAPGLLLGFLEAAILTAISVAISTRLLMLPNLIICFAVYVLGHLVPIVAQSAVGQIAYVGFIADLLSTLLPALDHFNIYGAISTGQNVWADGGYWYLVWATVYSVLYSTVAMLLALLLFEDRDLA